MASSIAELIAQNSNGQTINLAAIAKELGIRVVLEELASTTDLATMATLSANDKPVIKLNKSNDNKQNHNLVALLVADYILAPNKSMQKPVTYDVFNITDIWKNRFSTLMFLATGLAVPESIINMLDSVNFDADKYARSTNFLPHFTTSIVKGKDASFVLSNSLEP